MLQLPSQSNARVRVPLAHDLNSKRISMMLKPPHEYERYRRIGPKGMIQYTESYNALLLVYFVASNVYLLQPSAE